MSTTPRASSSLSSKNATVDSPSLNHGTNNVVVLPMDSNSVTDTPKSTTSNSQVITPPPIVVVPSIDDALVVDTISQNDSDPLHPQKIGSYRARAGNKISNTLSNLLPSSLSAKLHHSKKLQNETTAAATISTAPTTPQTPNKKYTKSDVSTPTTKGTHSRQNTAHTVEQETDMKPFPSFHDPATILLSSTTSNNNNTHMTRRRTDTINSQITNLSMSAGPSSSIIWAPNNPNDNSSTSNLNHQHPLSHPYLQNNLYSSSMQTFGSTNNNVTQNNNIDNLMVPQPFPTSNSSIQDNTNNNTWSPNNNITNSPMNNNSSSDIYGNRQRSKSTATNIYPETVMYDQKGMRNRTFTMSGSAYQPNGIYINGTNPMANNANGIINSGSFNDNFDLPLVDDDADPLSINWVTTDYSAPYVNQVSNLLPSNTISISNIFSLQQQNSQLSNVINLTSTSLVTLCARFGKVLSARTLKNLNFALVEFDSVDSAGVAIETLQNKEISMIGISCNVAYAKVIPSPVQVSSNFPMINNDNNRSLLQEQLFNGNFSLQQQGNITVPVFNPQFKQLQQQMQQLQQHQHQLNSQHNNQHNSNLSPSNSQPQQPQHSSSLSSSQITTADKEQCPFSLPPNSVKNQQGVLKEIIDSFGSDLEKSTINYVINNALKNEGNSDTSDFGPLAESHSNKEFDAPTLRELRKIIDANQMDDLEIEQLAMVMLDELPALSSDYLGNTIVQKLFDHSSDIIKDIMLRKTAKYLTTMGVHKNGTWACQKMIKKATTSRQKMLVAQGVEKYCTPLFNDQFGNYVIQCVLKFGFPWNNFIFENIIANFWTIAQNRYGSRAVRACLEAHNFITNEQTIVLSSIILLYVQYLITNGNGTLLVTWFLDTCNLPNRHQIFAKRLVPDIVELCCHKLSSLTILKILTFRGDDVTRNIILSTIFGPVDSDNTIGDESSNEEKSSTTSPHENLVKILNDKNNGPTFIYKVLSMPLLEDDIRAHIIKQVRNVLLDSSSSAQHHRRLMEEVGLASLNTQSPNSQGNQQRNSNGHSYNNLVPGQEVAKHISHVSVSSTRSNGGKTHNQGSTQAQPVNSSTVTMTQPLMTPAYTNSNYPGLSSTPLQAASINTNINGSNNHNYYNYPALYSMNSNTSSNFPYTDDLTTQLESIMINNENQTSMSHNANYVPNYGAY